MNFIINGALKNTGNQEISVLELPVLPPRYDLGQMSPSPQASVFSYVK